MLGKLGQLGLGQNLWDIAAPDINVYQNVAALPNLPVYEPTVVGVDTATAVGLMWEKYQTYILVGAGILGLVLLTKRR